MLKRFHKEIYACSRCGICRAKYTETVRYVCPVREHTGGFEHYFGRGRVRIARGIIEGELTYSDALAEVASTCLLCGNCREQCGSFDLKIRNSLVDPAAITRAMRAERFSAGMAINVHKMLASRIEKDKNSYGGITGERRKWADGLNLVTEEEVMLFTGCMSSYRKAFGQRETTRAVVKILKMAGVNSLGALDDEWCCGLPLLEIGVREMGRWKKQSSRYCLENV